MNLKSLLLLGILLGIKLSLFAQVPSKAISATDLDYFKDGNGYLLIFKVGQPVVASLNAFMEKENCLVPTSVAYYNID